MNHELTQFTIQSFFSGRLPKNCTPLFADHLTSSRFGADIPGPLFAQWSKLQMGDQSYLIGWGDRRAEKSRAGPLPPKSYRDLSWDGNQTV